MVEIPATFAEVEIHMKSLFNTILNRISIYKYNQYKKKLNVDGPPKLKEPAVVRLQKKLDKFVTKLSTSEVVLLGTLWDRFWLELAFMEALKYKEVKGLFERKQLEALQHYIIRGYPIEKVNKEFALIDGEDDIETLVRKFRGYCAEIKDIAIDNPVN